MRPGLKAQDGIKHVYICNSVGKSKSHNDLGIGNLVCQLLFDRLLSFVLSPLADQLMWWNYVKLDPRFSRKFCNTIHSVMGKSNIWKKLSTKSNPHRLVRCQDSDFSSKTAKQWIKPDTDPHDAVRNSVTEIKWQKAEA